jgi:hypothetical protein
MAQRKTTGEINETTTDKWYDNTHLVDTLFFIMPPLGLYCMLKSTKIVPHPVKIAAGIVVFMGIITAISWMVINA